MEFFWAIVLIAVLIVLSGVYVWRQVQTLRWLRTQENLASEDVSYYRWRSYRRLFGCLITVVLAAMFIGLFSLGIMQELDRLVELGQQPKEVRGELGEADERFVAFGLRYVGSIGLVMLVWLAIAFVDLMATRRFGMRHRRRIHEDRQAMLQRQLPLLRHGRNGQPD